jgi:hypothetical protein
LWNDCDATSVCLNQYSYKTQSGNCNGAGSCAGTNANVTLGQVCKNGASVAVSPTNTCGTGAQACFCDQTIDCVYGACSATPYLRGFNNALCTETNKAAVGNWIPSTSGNLISETNYKFGSTCNNAVATAFFNCRKDATNTCSGLTPQGKYYSCSAGSCDLSSPYTYSLSACSGGNSDGSVYNRCNLAYTSRCMTRTTYTPSCSAGVCSNTTSYSDLNCASCSPQACSSTSPGTCYTPPACTQNSDCTNTQVCNLGTNKCEELSCGVCKYANNHVCVNSPANTVCNVNDYCNGLGSCNRDCISDANCPTDISNTMGSAYCNITGNGQIIQNISFTNYYCSLSPSYACSNTNSISTIVATNCNSLDSTLPWSSNYCYNSTTLARNRTILDFSCQSGTCSNSNSLDLSFTNCNSGQLCNFTSSTCYTSVACTPGATQCSGSQIQICNALGQWGAATNCPSGQSCDSSLNPDACAVSCVPNSNYHCNANDLYWYDSCGNIGSMYSDCGLAGCTGVSTSCNTCTSGATQCSGSQIQTCVGGVWNTATNCVPAISSSESLSFNDCSSTSRCKTTSVYSSSCSGNTCQDYVSSTYVSSCESCGTPSTNTVNTCINPKYGESTFTSITYSCSVGICSTSFDKSITNNVCGLCEQCNSATGTCINIPVSSDPYNECTYTTCDGSANCINRCANFTMYNNRINFDESPQYYVPPSGQIPYVCTGNTVDSIPSNIISVISSYGYPITVSGGNEISSETKVISNPKPRTALNLAPYAIYNESMSICADWTSTTSYCQSHESSYTYNVITSPATSCYDYTKKMLISASLAVSKLTCYSYDAYGSVVMKTFNNPIISDLTSPNYTPLGTSGDSELNQELTVCADDESANALCLSYGYSAYNYTRGDYSACQKYSGSNWTIKTGIQTIASITCKYASTAKKTNANGIKLNSTLRFVLAGNSYAYACDNTSYDGVCPNDFNPSACGAVSDLDCGNQIFIDCLDVVNSTGFVIGNTCDYARKPVATNTVCGIQINASNLTRLHSQCLNGATITNSNAGLNNGCPVCLLPDNINTYSGTDVLRCVSEKDRLRFIEDSDYISNSASDKATCKGLIPVRKHIALETVNTRIDSEYYACPPNYIPTKNISTGVIRCIASTNNCDEGFINSLAVGCDTPITYNFTTKKWVIDPKCVFIDNGKYARYCGLNSHYDDYETYNNTFKILVK